MRVVLPVLCVGMVSEDRLGVLVVVLSSVVVVGALFALVRGSLRVVAVSVVIGTVELVVRGVLFLGASSLLSSSVRPLLALRASWVMGVGTSCGSGGVGVVVSVRSTVLLPG